MADGSSKPIKDVKVGDTVKAADPASGKTGAQPVVLLHQNHDTDLTDVTVSRTPANATSARSTKTAVTARLANAAVAAAVAVGAATVLHTTTHHPLYDATTHTFVEAGDLRPGVSRLVAPDGTTLTVTAVHSWTSTGKDMRDLTVAQVHTYYVIAGTTPVLVHNCSSGADDATPSRSSWQDSSGNIRSPDDVPDFIYRGVDVRHTGRGDVALRNPAQFKPYKGTVSAGDQPNPELLANKPGWAKISVQTARDNGVQVYGDGGTEGLPPGHIAMVGGRQEIADSVVDWYPNPPPPPDT